MPCTVFVLYFRVYLFIFLEVTLMPCVSLVLRDKDDTDQMQGLSLHWVQPGSGVTCRLIVLLLCVRLRQ